MTSAEITAPVPTAKPDVPAWRLIVTLAVAGALAAMALSVVYELTLPAIEANKARVLEEAVQEVLKAPQTVVSLRVTETGLEREDEVVYAVSDRRIDRVFVGYDAEGRAVGYALVGAAYGYGSDPIRLIFGYDPATAEVVGLKILDHKETPGIGTKIETDAAFVGQWWRPVTEGTRRTASRRLTAEAPAVGVRADAAPAAEADAELREVDMISGATISSKAVIQAINKVLTTLGDRLGPASDLEEGR